MVIFSVSPAFGRSSCTLSAIADTIPLPSIWMAIGDDRDPVNPSPPAWHGNTLLVLGRAHELHVAHSERRRQLIEGHHRRIATTSLLSESARELADLRMLEPPLDDTPTLEAHPRSE